MNHFWVVVLEYEALFLNLVLQPALLYVSFAVDFYPFSA